MLCCASVWGRTEAAAPTTKSPWPSSNSTTPLCCTWKRSPSSWPSSASWEKRALSAKVSKSYVMDLSKRVSFQRKSSVLSFALCRVDRLQLSLFPEGHPWGFWSGSFHPEYSWPPGCRVALRQGRGAQWHASQHCVDWCNFRCKKK